MRAHSQRRLIWVLNGIFALGLVALVAWVVLDVQKAVADSEYLRPRFAEAAVESFRNQPPSNRSALKPPVSEKELEEIDRREFRTGDKNSARFHWLYSGPMPPPPPEVRPAETVRGPVQDDLQKLGRVRMLIHVPAHDGQEVAEETVVSWEFAKTKNMVAFSPGDFFKDPGEPETASIKLVDVKSKIRGGTCFEIIYEVYADPESAPVKKGILEYDTQIPLEESIAARVRVGGEKTGGSGETAEGGDAGRVEGGVTVVGPEETVKLQDLEPIVTWEDRNRARVEFDQKTIDWLRSADSDAIAKSVKTQVARDRQGRVIGLRITGISSETPVDKFDVKPGDIVVSINDQGVKSRSDAMNIVQGLDPDVSRVKVVIDRNGRLITFVIDPRDPKTRRAARYLDNP